MRILNNWQVTQLLLSHTHPPIRKNMIITIIIIEKKRKHRLKKTRKIVYILMVVVVVVVVVAVTVGTYKKKIGRIEYQMSFILITPFTKKTHTHTYDWQWYS